MFEVDKITELESLPDDTEDEMENSAEQDGDNQDPSIIVDPDTGMIESSHELVNDDSEELSDDELRDEINGQKRIF